MIAFSLHPDRPIGRAGFVAAVAGIAAILGLITGLMFFIDAMTGGANSAVILLFGINAVLVVGYQTFVGNTGIISFGHVAFMAIGAYAAGIVSVPVRLKEIALPDLPGFLATTEFGTVGSLLVGGLAAAGVAAVVGVPLMRLVGDSAGIATLGLLVIVNNVIAEADTLTRGSQAFYGVPKTSTFEIVFGTLAAVVLLSAALKWSRRGLEARAVRDDPTAAEASGIGRVRTRLWPWVTSAFITGVGGGLYAHFLSGFSPTSFFLGQIIGVLAMAIVGGIRSITGVLIGALIISVVSEYLRRLEGGAEVAGFELPVMLGLSQLVLGITLILVLRWRVNGLLGAREVHVALVRGQRRSR